MSVVSGSQMSAVQAWKNPYATEDNPNALGDLNGGWRGGETPASLGAQNLTGAGKSMAWRTPSREAQGTQTIGSWYGFSPSWHERYKSE